MKLFHTSKEDEKEISEPEQESAPCPAEETEPVQEVAAAPEVAKAPSPAEECPGNPADVVVTKNHVKKKPGGRFAVRKDAFSTHASMAIMLLGALFFLLGLKAHTADATYVYTQILLPFAAALLFVLLLQIFGERALWVIAVPFLMGVIFLYFRIWTGEYPILQRWLCSVLYAVITAVFMCTVLNLLHTKIPLTVLMVAPLAYHIFVEDIFVDNVGGIDKFALEGEFFFQASMQELGILCFMLAGMFLCFAMHKTCAAYGPGAELPPDLPRMQGPRRPKP